MYLHIYIYKQRAHNDKDKDVFRRSLDIFWWSSTRIYTRSAGAMAGSSQHRHASVYSRAARWTSAVTLTPRSRWASSNKRPISQWSSLYRNASIPPSRDPSNLLINSRAIPQPSRSSHDTVQSNKPPVLPAAYAYSGGASSSRIRTETRLGKRASYDASAPSISHLRRSRRTRTLLSLLL